MRMASLQVGPCSTGAGKRTFSATREERVHDQRRIRRHHRARLHAGHGRAACHDAAGAARRRRHQDRAAGRRLGPRAGRAQGRSLRPLRRLQPRQALDRARPQVGRRQGRGEQAHGQGQRRHRKLPARRHLAAGLRLRGRQEGQSQGRLLLGVGLRPDRPLQQAADRRRADPGVQRHDGDEPDARRHAVAAGHDRRRRHDRPLHLPGAGAGADAPAALRRGLLHRFQPDALGRRLPGRQADGMGVLQRRAAAALHAGRQLQDRRTATSW